LNNFSPKFYASSISYYSHLKFSHGEGCRCWTTDGSEYIDLICGNGSVILGHAHSSVTQAVIRQLEKGSMLPGPGPVFNKLRELLLDFYPHADDILTFKTGSEAVAASIRLARAYTKRNKILRIGYHGWHDQVVSPHVRCHSYDESKFKKNWPPGVPHDKYENLMLIWHGSNLHELLDLLHGENSDIAAVIIDPVQLRSSDFEEGIKLANAIHNIGALLIFDESKTGFRVDLGGVQSLYGLSADLTILNKAIANGLPLSVVLGRNDLITIAKPARIKGTFGLETAAIAAAVATINILKSVDAPKILNELGTYLIDGLNEVIQLSGLDSELLAVPYQWACMPYIHFRGDEESLQDKFYTNLLNQGVLMLHSHMSYVSLSMTKKDIDKVVISVQEVLTKLI